MIKNKVLLALLTSVLCDASLTSCDGLQSQFLGDAETRGTGGPAISGVEGAVTLEGVPEEVVTDPQLSVTVSHDVFTHYVYNLSSQEIECSDELPKAQSSIDDRIDMDLDQNGHYLLCVWGVIGADIFQGSPTVATWKVELPIPTTSFELESSINPRDFVDGDVLISGLIENAKSDTVSIQYTIQEDLDNEKCLNADEAAFDGSCTEVLDAAVSGLGYEINIDGQLLNAGSSYKVEATAVGPTGLKSSFTKSFDFDNSVIFHVGIQTSGGNPSYVQKFSFDTTDNSIVTDGTIDISSVVANGLLRGFSGGNDGTLLVGDGASRGHGIIDGDESVSLGPDLTTGGTPTELGNIHGVCQLPNDHYVSGAYSSSDVYEFDSDGTYLRTIYPGTLHTLTECVAASNTDLYLIEYNASSDNDGDIVRFRFDGSSWSEHSRFDLSVVIGNSSSIYSLILHTNGDIIAPPQDDGGSKNRKLIRCAGGDLTVCAAVGGDITDGTDGYLQGAVQIPGSDDLLLISSKHMYLYDLSAGTSSSIFDMSTLTNMSQVRGMH